MNFKYAISLSAIIALTGSSCWSAAGRPSREVMNLFTGAEKGDLHLVQQSLRKGADINATTPDGQTALITAIAAGKKNIIDELLKEGAAVNVGNIRQTALFEAVRYANPYADEPDENGYRELVKKLVLDYRADTNLRNEELQKRLEIIMTAQARPQPAPRPAPQPAMPLPTQVVPMEITQRPFAIPQRPIVPTRDMMNLFEGARTGNLPLVIQALDRGVDINTVTPTGETALCVAIENGHKNIIDTLLARGAQVNVPDVGRQTALAQAVHYAYKYDYLDLIIELLDRGADVSALSQFLRPNLAERLITVIVSGTTRTERPWEWPAPEAIDQQARDRVANILTKIDTSVLSNEFMQKLNSYGLIGG